MIESRWRLAAALFVFSKVAAAANFAATPGAEVYKWSSLSFQDSVASFEEWRLDYSFETAVDDTICVGSDYVTEDAKKDLCHFKCAPGGRCRTADGSAILDSTEDCYCQGYDSEHDDEDSFALCTDLETLQRYCAADIHKQCDSVEFLEDHYTKQYRGFMNNNCDSQDSFAHYKLYTRGAAAVLGDCALGQGMEIFNAPDTGFSTLEKITTHLKIKSQIKSLSMKINITFVCTTEVVRSCRGQFHPN